jgi:hypothetical protein
MCTRRGERSKDAADELFLYGLAFATLVILTPLVIWLLTR